MVIFSNNKIEFQCYVLFNKGYVFLEVAKYHNKKDTKKIGERIQELREANEFTVEDISYMTGFARNTIISIEKGANTDTSHLVEVAKAIGVHPMELLNIDIEIKPRYQLSAKRKANSRLTLKINKLVSNTEFFEKPKFVRDVVLFLEDDQKIKAESAHISVILKRLVVSGKLKMTKSGRQNQYFKKKK